MRVGAAGGAVVEVKLGAQRQVALQHALHLVGVRAGVRFGVRVGGWLGVRVGVRAGIRLRVRAGGRVLQPALHQVEERRWQLLVT